jgi:hyperosmotically inducible protein
MLLWRGNARWAMPASAQTPLRNRGDDGHPSPQLECATMTLDYKRLVLSAILAGATSALLAGCGNQKEIAATPPATTTVGNEIDDSVVTTKVKTALYNDPDIKSFDLKVETRKGAVQLSGFVVNQSQIDRAIATARSVEGVKSVDNSMSIKVGTESAGNALDDGIITAKVKSALLADPKVNGFDIAVKTRKGEAQLSGFVDSQAQIDGAVAIVGKVEGVTKIDNQLSIKK